LGLCLFTAELDRRMRAHGELFTSINALHPGNMLTGITRDFHWFARDGQKTLRHTFFKTNLHGSATTRLLAMSPRLKGVSGKYFEHCMPVPMASAALDPETGKKFWEFAEGVLKVDLDEMFGWKRASAN